MALARNRLMLSFCAWLSVKYECHCCQKLGEKKTNLVCMALPWIEAGSSGEGRAEGPLLPPQGRPCQPIRWQLCVCPPVRTPLCEVRVGHWPARRKAGVGGSAGRGWGARSTASPVSPGSVTSEGFVKLLRCEVVSRFVTQVQESVRGSVSLELFSPVVSQRSWCPVGQVDSMFG